MYSEAYKEYADSIFRHCFFRVHNRELAHDLTQETFMKVWDYLRKGNEVKNIRAFLYKTATNLIIDNSRTRKEKISLDKMIEEFDFEIPVDERGATDARIDVQLIYKYLDELEPIYKEVVVFRYVEQLDPREIAEIVGETANTISVRINRGIKKLQEQIKQGKND